MAQNLHKTWIRIAAIIIGGFAPVFFLGTIPALNDAARFTLDLLSWPLDGFPDYTSGEIRFLSALTGGFLAGWGVTLWCLATWVHDHAPEAIRRSVVTGACAWFLLDSAGSIASGNASNALFNLVVLLLVVGPMWTPARPSQQKSAIP